MQKVDKKEKFNLKNTLKFYNNNIKKKHIICFIISLILFGIFFTMFINNKVEIKDLINQTNQIGRFENAFKEKILLIIVIVFSGITPYLYIPIIGLIGISYKLALGICNLSVVNMVITSIFCVLELLFINLAVAIGIYLCNMFTKKFKYEQRMGFSFADVKQRYLELTKSKKLKAYKEKRLKRKIEFEKLNVKIDYRNIGILTIISIIFTVIFTLISGV